MIWQPPLVAKKERYISYNKAVQGCCLAIEEYEKNESFLHSTYGFPEFTGYLPIDMVEVTGYVSSTGVSLPSDYHPPSYNYKNTYGDITVNVRYPARGGVSFGEGAAPWIIDFGCNKEQAASFMHNCVAKNFIGAMTLAMIIANFPDINYQDAYPLYASMDADYPAVLAVVGIINADGTITHYPIECNGLDDIEELAITFPGDVCMCGVDEGWDLTQCHWLIAQKGLLHR